MKDSNARINFSFYSDNYPDIDLTFNCNEDLAFCELLDYFRRFAIAMSFSPTIIEKYLGEDD